MDIVLYLSHKAIISLKLHKCEFFKESADYLGHRISSGKLEVTENTKNAVQKALPPQDVLEVKSFLGMC